MMNEERGGEDLRCQRAFVVEITMQKYNLCIAVYEFFLKNI